MIVFENRAIYGPTDPVSALYVTVECHPGQAQAIKDFVSGVCAKGGVYAVDIEEATISEAAKEDLGYPASVEVQSDPVFETVNPVVPFIRAEPDVPTELQGEVHVEQAIQQPDDEPAPADVGPGAEAGGLGEAGPVDAHEDGEVAVATEEGAGGSLERSP